MKLINKYPKTLSFLVLVLMLGGVYNKFIFGNWYYVFRNDLASDSYFQFLPYLSHLHDYIRNTGFPMWSFNDGIGNRIFPFPGWIADPFFLTLLILPKSFLLKGLIYAQIAKIIAAFYLMYGYLRLIKLENYSSIVGALFYAFSGHIILRGCWYAYSTEAVSLVLLLFTYEYGYQKAKWWPISIGVFGIPFAGVFSLYIYSILIFFYGFIRWYFDDPSKRIKLSKFIFNFFAGYLLGVALNLWQILPALSTLSTSARVVGESSNFLKLISSPLFAFNSSDLYLDSFLRLFSIDIMGYPNDGGAGHNFFEEPLLYCGILQLVLFFQVIFSSSKYRNVCASFLFLATLYILFPYFRFFLNAFSGYYYKISDFWVTAFLTINCAIGVDLLLQKKIKLLPLFLSLIFFLCPLILIKVIDGNLLVSKIYSKSLILFVIYFLLILSVAIKKPSNLTLALILIMAVGELTASSYGNISHRQALTSKVEAERLEYNDNTKDALKWLKSIDNSFYRIEKFYNSTFLSDAMYQNYRGTKSYNSFNSQSYVEFIKALDVPFYIPNNVAYINGFNEYEQVLDLLSVKYFFLKENYALLPRNAKLLKQVGDVKIYANEDYLPLAFLYDRCIPRSTFAKYDNFEKERKILDTCILDDSSLDRTKVSISEDSGEINNPQPLPTFDLKLINASAKRNNFPKNIELEALDNDPSIQFELHRKNKGTLLIEFEIGSDIATEGQIFFGDSSGSFSEGSSIHFSVDAGVKKYRVIANHIANFVRFDFSNRPGFYTVNNFSVREINSENYYKKVLPRQLDRLRNSSAKILLLTNNEIKASIYNSKPGVMFFSIPFDTGWAIFVNGKKARSIRVNNGFLGCYLNSGANLITLTYELPYLKFGFIIAVLFFCFGFMCICFDAWKNKKGVFKCIRLD